MSFSAWVKRRWVWLAIGVPVVSWCSRSAATFVYIHFIEGDPPPPLTFSSVSDASGSASGSPDAPLTGGVGGTWKATPTALRATA